jgi:hypothetical protein
MRRERVAKYSKPINKTFTVFGWKLCVGCGKEFRREFGYKFVTNNVFVKKYICSVCAPNKELANTIAIKYELDRKNVFRNLKPPRKDKSKIILDKLEKLDL